VFGPPVKSITAIAKTLLLPWSTIQNLLLRFERGGRVLATVLEKRPREFRTIPPALKAHLLNPSIL